MTVQTFNRMQRDGVFDEVRAKVLKVINCTPDKIDLNKSCLFHAVIGCHVLSRSAEVGGIRPVLQSGSAFWPRTTEEAGEADQELNTHFGYKWEEDKYNSLIQAAIDLNITPTMEKLEVHTWIGVPATGEIIDFTTGLWPSACKELTGDDWEFTHPPEYLWGVAEALAQEGGLPPRSDRHPVDSPLRREVVRRNQTPDLRGV